MTKKSTNGRMLDEKLKRHVRDTYVVGILVCITLVLIVLIIRNKERARVVSEQVARSEQKLRELLSTESMREQAKQDSDALDDFLQHCRSADDIPDFDGPYVIAHRDGSRLVYHVPEGKHQLEISVYRLEISDYRLLKLTNPLQNQSVGIRPTKENTWMVSLRGDTGYLFEVISDREAQHLRWDLSANNPEFESRKETMRMGAFGRVWVGALERVRERVRIQRSPIFYPNQAQSREMYLRARVYGSDPITEWEKSAATPPPMVLFSDLWRSKTGNDAGAGIRIDVTLISEGPTQVAATDAADIIRLWRSDLLMPYAGGGKYELRATK